MPVGIGEIAGVAAPERPLRRFRHGGASQARTFNRGIDLVHRPAIPGKRHAAKRGDFSGADIRVLGELIGRPYRNDHGSGLEKADALGLRRLAPEAERFIERNAAREVGHPERHQRQLRIRTAHR